ncbi:hypothetical protein AN958_08938 [Leucoagaricus sp. SymC.cos]|nr:hypothetical protein AN958_08938 [Leucoagaricus sp. SymC.cos]
MNSEAVPTRVSDVWAFACTCYEILTGATPFRHQGMSQVNLMRAFDNDKGGVTPNRPVKLSRDEEQIWAGTLVKCWKTKASERPDTASILPAFSKWTTSGANSDKLWTIARRKSGFVINYELVHNVLRQTQQSK